jgi:hypothetical protein
VRGHNEEIYELESETLRTTEAREGNEMKATRNAIN